MTFTRPQILRSVISAGGDEPVGDGAGPRVSDLVRAARHLDGNAVTDTVGASIAAYGVLWTWERLVRPAWADLSRVRTGAPGVSAAEGLFGQAVSRSLTASRHPRERLPAHVLLACADEEHHTLAVEVLAAALAEVRAGTTVLGARVPPRALATAAGRLHPAVVIVWSQSAGTAGPGQLEVLVTACPGLVVIAAGPGWDGTRLPATVTWSTTVLSTLTLTRELLGSHRGGGRVA